jgi:hypothetical protein
VVTLPLGRQRWKEALHWVIGVPGAEAIHADLDCLIVLVFLPTCSGKSTGHRRSNRWTAKPSSGSRLVFNVLIVRLSAAAANV